MTAAGVLPNKAARGDRAGCAAATREQAETVEYAATSNEVWRAALKAHTNAFLDIGLARDAHYVIEALEQLKVALQDSDFRNVSEDEAFSCTVHRESAAAATQIVSHHVYTLWQHYLGLAMAWHLHLCLV